MIQSEAQTPLVAHQFSQVGYRSPRPRTDTQAHQPAVLIVGQASQAADRLRGLLRSYKFNVHHCAQLEDAQEIAASRKLDGVFIFYTSTRHQEFVDNLRTSGLNRLSLVCAILSAGAQQTWGSKIGCNFTYDIALFGANLQKLLRVMFGLIVKEHRRYFRSPAPVEVEIVSPSAGSASAQCLDLSTTGIALQLTPPAFRPDDRVNLSIDLFDGQPLIRVDAQVRWSEPGGKAGLSFVQTPLPVLERLQAWIEKTIHAAEKSISVKS